MSLFLCRIIPQGILLKNYRITEYLDDCYCYGVGGTGGKSRVARHVRAASPVYLSSFFF
jgi:hypothetical protein